MAELAEKMGEVEHNLDNEEEWKDEDEETAESSRQQPRKK